MLDDLLARIEKLGAKGFIVSIVYGPCGDKGLFYSVDVMAPSGSSFEKPFLAESFEQAVFIAENEIKKRGWEKMG